MQTARSTVCLSTVTNTVQKLSQALVKSFIFYVPECKHSGSSSFPEGKKKKKVYLLDSQRL